MAERHPSDPPPPGPLPLSGIGEERLRQVFERAPIAIGLLTPDGRWFAFNERLPDCLGYTREELRFLRYQDFTHPEDVAQDQAGRERLLAGEIAVHRTEKRYIRKDGTIIWGALTMSLVRAADGSPDYLIATMEEITERKRTEEALRVSEARLRRMVANAPGLTYELVYRPDGSKGFTFVSERARTLFGIEPEAILRDHMVLFSLIHPGDQPGFYASSATAVAALAPWRWEGRALLPTGEERHVLISAYQDPQPDGTVISDGLLIDITEQRRAAMQRDESEQRYRSLFEHHPDAVYSMDLEGRFLTANPAWGAMTGYDPAELLGQPFDVVVVPAHRESVRRHFARALTGVALTYEAVCADKQGRGMTVEVTNIPIIVDGTIVGVHGIARDLTGQRLLEAQLQQAQKMDAIGRLAGGVAHDFNNLLTAIMANAELALTGLPEGEAREDVEAIHETARSAAALTRQLLTFSRPQAGRAQLVDLNTVIRETKRLLRSTLGEEVIIAADLHAASATVLADPSQLEQVLVNLAVNARDAMPQGGSLTFHTREESLTEGPPNQRHGLPPGDYVVLSVEDTGTGIPPEIRGRIFEPFFTTKEQGKGTGLGLATVYGIVKQMGGSIEVASSPGEGTTFTIFLPRSRDSDATTDGSLAAPPPGGHETVLVVEDEGTVRASVRRILARHGYTVREARHGADALRILVEEAGAIQLVVTDLVMPEMGGRELVAALRERADAPRVLFMSGYDERAGMGQEALSPGAGFIEKPFTVDELLRSVRAALDAPMA